MKLAQIVTLANAAVRLPLLAMARSLREVGSDLPIRVIPYAEPDFELECGAEWWEDRAVLDWLEGHRCHQMMRKYQCLLTENYQFVDTDVVFLRDPDRALRPYSGFVTSCGHWHNPAQTVTEQSRSLLHARTTTWQKGVFNAGQFACDRVLYSIQTLQARAESPDFIETCLRWPYHDQPGLNLLVHSTEIPVTNLTLPPVCMESTWAGDYRETPERYWRNEDRKPYLLHWAGTKPDGIQAVDQLFLQFLTRSEKEEWTSKIRAQNSARTSLAHRLRCRARKVWKAVTE